jgi:hypothetical protein
MFEGFRERKPFVTEHSKLSLDTVYCICKILHFYVVIY